MFAGIIFLIIFVVIGYVMSGREFRKRVKEILYLYNFTEQYLISYTVWTSPVHYKSEFYEFDYCNTLQLERWITYMISDALKCFKKQGSIAKMRTENWHDELFFLQRKMLYIHTFR